MGMIKLSVNIDLADETIIENFEVKEYSDLILMEVEPELFSNYEVLQEATEKISATLNDKKVILVQDAESVRVYKVTPPEIPAETSD